MKKLMIAAAASIAAVSAFAAVESPNIVGYTSQDVAAGKFAMVGVQFEGVNAQPMTIGELVKGDFLAVPNNDDAFLSTANQIQHWTGSAYNKYYYLEDAWYDDGTEEGAYKLGWADGYGELTADTLAPGDAAWFKATTGACTILVAGQVYSGETEVTCTSGKFTMVANATPVPICLNDSTKVEFENLVPVANNDDQFLTTATQVQEWTGSAYNKYYYISDAWYDDGSEEGAYKEGWADGYGEFTSENIPVGRGFWVKANTGTFKITFK